MVLCSNPNFDRFRGSIPIFGHKKKKERRCQGTLFCSADPRTQVGEVMNLGFRIPVEIEPQTEMRGPAHYNLCARVPIRANRPILNNEYGATPECPYTYICPEGQTEVEVPGAVYLNRPAPLARKLTKLCSLAGTNPLGNGLGGTSHGTNVHTATNFAPAWLQVRSLLWF